MILSGKVAGLESMYKFITLVHTKYSLQGIVVAVNSLPRLDSFDNFYADKCRNKKN